MANLGKKYYTLNGMIPGEEVVGGSGDRNDLPDTLGSVAENCYATIGL